MLHGLPPRPPLNLDPVELCQDRAEVERFTDGLGYLRLILRAADSQRSGRSTAGRAHQTMFTRSAAEIRIGRQGPWQSLSNCCAATMKS